MKIERDKNDIQELNQQNLETSFSPNILDHDIIQLYNNFIPNRLVSLEKIFDNNDISKIPLFNPPKDKI